MQPRLNPFTTNPGVYQAMSALQDRVDAGGLEHGLQELVKMRASQINGCAFCLHMHSKDARAHGETEERLYLLNAWRESPLYSARERAALAWTEALTNLPQNGASDADYALLNAHFTPAEQMELTLLIVVINGWNRFAVGFRSVHPLTANGKPIPADTQVANA
ncbi:MAG: carboxymuconolactone decarboxylase family protein [Rhodospirillaceae bacterium]|nr:carboxymuconolactone decarboxylase family protein [Rhodospirillaceae bacterium]